MYTKTVYNGYIYAAGEMQGGIPITTAEFAAICNAFRYKPTPEPGYNYLLKDGTLEWVLVELPPAPDDYEISPEEAMEILMGGGEG